jgi:hypothetical protein
MSERSAIRDFEFDEVDEELKLKERQGKRLGEKDKKKLERLRGKAGDFVFVRALATQIARLDVFCDDMTLRARLIELLPLINEIQTNASLNQTYIERYLQVKSELS